jgi:hypothetical protein
MSRAVPTFRYILALLGVATLVMGCSSDPGSLTGDSPTDGDPGGPAPEVPPSPATPAPPPPHDPTFAETTLERARTWIAASMPYCGGPNGGKDVICGGTCSRSGSAENPEWDAYRSDCSGFVSWSWGLPAPGRITKTLAPYDTTESSVIEVDALAPGDALNSGEHVMLFGGWVDKAAGKATILQESRCGTVASEKVSTFTPIDTTTLEISDGRQFRAIRFKGRPQ